MMSIPLGFRFIPTHDELITCYLLPKALGFQVPYNPHVLEMLLYGEKADPTRVFSDVDDSHWVVSEGNDRVIYVLTKLSKINNDKTRIARRAGCGTWSGQTGGKRIKNGSGELIGSMKMFGFEADGKRDDNHHWIMHEYSLAGIYSDSKCRGLKHKDYVICKIRRTSKRKGVVREDDDVVALSPFKKLKAATISNHVTDPSLMSIQEYVPVLTSGRPEGCYDHHHALIISDHVTGPTSMVSDDCFGCSTGPSSQDYVPVLDVDDCREGCSDRVVGEPSFEKPKAAMISNYREEEDCLIMNLDGYFACSSGPSIEQYVPVLDVDNRPEESNSRLVGASEGGSGQPLANTVFDHRTSIILDDDYACSIGLDDLEEPDFSLDEIEFNLDGLDLFMGSFLAARTETVV